MCGIVGIAGDLTARLGGRTAAVLENAASSIAHRGPDGAGVWVSEDAPLGFGHRRLAVIDLSTGGAQPMVLSGSPLSAVTFNGEIYNYRSLRASLVARGERFRSQSDTEVLLRSCRTDGVLATAAAVRGMFAFAFYDGATRSLWLVRDRFGEKPLYYSIWDGGLAFASELRALRLIPGLPSDLDQIGLDLLMRRSCIGGERTILASVKKVLPGTAIRLPVDGPIRFEAVERHVYWSAEAEADRAARDPFKGSADDAVQELDELLGASVLGAIASDVPIGAFLSSGVDSTAVVSQLVQRSAATVRTFTIGLEDGHRNEADDARAIAGHLGTDHTELTVNAREAMDVIPRLATMYDEPFADSSQIPTALVCALAREHVTVALSGDGGDELFGGYGRYRLAPQIRNRVDRLPRALRRLGTAGIDVVPQQVWRRADPIFRRGPLRRFQGRPDERVAKLGMILRSTTIDEVFELLTTSFWDRSPLVNPPESPLRELPGDGGALDRMMLNDLVTYLPDDILTKVDRAAMAVSLETRLPMLDPDIYSFACRLDPLLKVPEAGSQKLILREVLARRVPTELWDFPKRGFSIPLETWLREDLRDWATDLLSREALERTGVFDRVYVSELLDDHLRGVRDWSSRLWNVLMFQAWHDAWVAGEWSER